MAWPVLVIGARSFTVKFSKRAIYLASLLGYDLSQILQSLRSGLPDPHRYALLMQLLSVCTAHMFTSAVPREEPWTAEQWVDYIDAVVPDSEHAEVLRQATLAVTTAVVKHASDRTPKTEPSPTPETTVAVPVQ